MKRLPGRSGRAASALRPYQKLETHIHGILLAAGASRRMGQPKLLLPWNGMPLVRHAAVTALATQLDKLVVVTGFRAQHVAAALDGLSLEIIHNPGWLDGQSTSLRVGIQAAAGADAAVVLLSDQPLLRAASIDRLIDAYRRQRALIVAPRYEDRRGNPVLFDRLLFDELLAIKGDRGAREVIEAHHADLALVEVDDRGVLLDVDTPDAYWELLN